MFPSIYTPVVWIATLLSLKMVVSLTKSVYIYSCYLDRLLSERYKKSDAKVRIAIFSVMSVGYTKSTFVVISSP